MTFLIHTYSVFAVLRQKTIENIREEDMSGSNITHSFSAHPCVHFGSILLETSVQVKPC